MFKFIQIHTIKIKSLRSRAFRPKASQIQSQESGAYLKFAKGKITESQIIIKMINNDKSSHPTSKLNITDILWYFEFKIIKVNF